MVAYSTILKEGNNNHHYMRDTVSEIHEQIENTLELVSKLTPSRERELIVIKLKEAKLWLTEFNPYE